MPQPSLFPRISEEFKRPTLQLLLFMTSFLLGGGLAGTYFDFYFPHLHEALVHVCENMSPRLSHAFSLTFSVETCRVNNGIMFFFIACMFLISSIMTEVAAVLLASMMIITMASFSISGDPLAQFLLPLLIFLACVYLVFFVKKGATEQTIE